MHVLKVEAKLNIAGTTKDTYIGWRFAGMAYLKSMPWRRLFLKHKRRDIGIDLSLVHDIVPVTDEAFEVLDIDHFMQWGSPDGN
jgi:hypothetical protein